MSGPELAPRRLGEKHNPSTEVMKPIKFVYHKENLVEEIQQQHLYYVIMFTFCIAPIYLVS